MSNIYRRLEQASKITETIGFSSIKNNCMLFCESRLEVAACIEREFNPRILRYTTQPSTEVYLRDNGNRLYTPDCLTLTEGGRYYFEEVKPASLLENPKLVEKLEYLSHYFKEIWNADFVVNTVNSAEVSKRIENLSLLYPYLVYHVSSDELTMYESLPASLPFSDLVKQVRLTKLNDSLAYALLAHKFFKYSNETIINPATMLEKCDHA